MPREAEIKDRDWNRDNEWLRFLSGGENVPLAVVPKRPVDESRPKTEPLISKMQVRAVRRQERG